MVTFTAVPLPDSRIPQEIVAKFSSPPKVSAWTLTDDSGAYTGVIIEGLSDAPHGEYRQVVILLDRTERALRSAKKIAIEQIVRAEADIQGILGSQLDSSHAVDRMPTTMS